MDLGGSSSAKRAVAAEAIVVPRTTTAGGSGSGSVDSVSRRHAAGCAGTKTWGLRAGFGVVPRVKKPYQSDWYLLPTCKCPEAEFWTSAHAVDQCSGMAIWTAAERARSGGLAPSMEMFGRGAAEVERAPGIRATCTRQHPPRRRPPRASIRTATTRGKT
jgi:hypothetical protein